LAWEGNTALGSLINGKQGDADGLFATCRNTITDLWLPLIGYLTFFCGLLNLLIDSRAMEKVARFLSPVFHRVFPELRKDHPAYGFMTLELRGELPGPRQCCHTLRIEGDGKHAGGQSDEGPGHQQPDHVPLPACCGAHLAPDQHHRLPRGTGRCEPGGHHDPDDHHLFAGTLAALFMVAGRQRINLFNLPVMLGVAGHQRHHRRLMAYIGTCPAWPSSTSRTT
jgi:hypothetical protein